MSSYHYTFILVAYYELFISIEYFLVLLFQVHEVPACKTTIRINVP